MAVSILGFTTQNIVMVISIEWFLDRFGCISKIMVDSLIVGILDHLLVEDSVDSPHDPSEQHDHTNQILEQETRNMIQT